MALRDLIRKPIFDKNGKRTTVLVRPEATTSVPPKKIVLTIPTPRTRYDVPALPTVAHARTVNGEWDGEKLEHEHR